ncbi:hypothetical protein [Spirosoma sordidisoli]|uniref:Crassvirus muzzle protein N-terminal region domain-containing protein n=1 Tax=Spirosoma sordidisoli TaxID=2502893 RepID=A0A4V1RWA8_9BACT|nr:hypothetical protein [Spirosoma sordidisoli]RYC69618.1 hypothetical protein EQG79_13525 [Spirosoma sordidisoli]
MRHRQTFEKGMSSDLAPLLTPPGTYQYAHSLYLGLTGDGRGMALTVEKPERPVTVTGLPASYRLVGLQGLVASGDYLAFLTNPNRPSGVARDLIARLTLNIDGLTASAQVLFDDRRDPAGAQLNLPAGVKLQTRLETETESLMRVYWNDGVNEPRCLTLADGYDAFGSPHHLSTQDYPRRWSVHQFALQPAVLWGTPMFEKTTEEGSLLSGFYRYSYRYRSGSVESAPFPLSTPLTLRQDMGEPDLTKPVQMEASGVSTKSAIHIIVDQPDDRWEEAELLMSYSADGSSWSDLVIADRRAVPERPSVGPAELLRLTHDKPAGLGTTVSLARLSQIDQVVSQAGVMTLHKQKLILGDLTLSMPLDPPTQTVTLSPKLVDMPLDESGFPTSPNRTLGLAYTFKQAVNDPPLTESAYKRQDGTIATRTKPIVADYRDYKGVQVAHSRVGLRGGESYPYALVLFDMIGQPTFAWPIGTFAAPNRYDDPAGNGTFPYAPTAARNLGTALGMGFVARPMGLSVSGINIPVEMVFDAAGRQQVSGFAIVRGNPSGRIKAQGIALPALWEQGGRDKFIVSIPSYTNHLTDQPTSDGFGLFNDIPAKAGAVYRHLAGWMTFLSPDLMVEGSLDTNPPTGTRLRLLGSMHGPDDSNHVRQLDGDNRQHYVKAYRYIGKSALSLRPAARSRPNPGETTNIRQAYKTVLNQTLEKFYADDQSLVFSPGVTSSAGLAQQTPGYLLKVDGFSLVDRGESPTKPAGYAIVNLEVNTPPAASQNQTFQWTNHFQPLTEIVLGEVPQVFISGKACYRFDEVEVWGGDTYLPLIDMARMLPYYAPVGGYIATEGHGHGIFTVIESKFNHALRYGRTYKHVGTMPTIEATGGGGGGYRQAINVFQPEDWNVNQGLQSKETVRLFQPLPADIRLERRWPQGLAWSQVKSDGQRLDAYRRIPAPNLFLLEGENGPVTGFAVLFGELYAGQFRAVSKVRVNERQLITDATGKPLQIGEASGAEISGADTLTSRIGWQAVSHYVVTSRAFYWLDRRNGKFYRFSQAGIDCLSDRDGLHDALQNTDLSAFSVVYDEENELVHLLCASERISYSEKANAFVAWHDWVNGLAWAISGHVLVTSPDGSSLFRMGKDPDSRPVLRYRHVPQPGQPLYFDNILIGLRPDWIEAIDVESSMGQQVTLTPDTDGRFRFRDGRLLGPLRGRSQSYRMYGEWISISITMTPTADPTLLLSEIEGRLLYRS